MNNEKTILYISQGFVFLNALIWLVAGVAGLFRLHTLTESVRWLVLLVDVGMLGYGLVQIALGFFLRLHRKDVYFAILVLISLSVILALFDDLGWVDLMAMLPALITVTFLLITKKSLLAN